MATSTGKTHCARCDKAKCTFKCGGCLEDFCSKHLGDHRQELNRQLDTIGVNRDIFRQSLTEQTKEPKNHPSIQQIDKWERNSIAKIQKTADEARQVLITHITGHFDQIEMNLSQLTNQLREVHEEDDFNEINLRQFNEELTRLATELAKPSNALIRQDSSSLINNIHVDVSGRETNSSTSSTEAYKPLAVMQSKIDMDITQKMATMMNRLSTIHMQVNNYSRHHVELILKEDITHMQIDDYSRRRIKEISEAVIESIARVVAETQAQQARLLNDASYRLPDFEEQRKHYPHIYVDEHNAAKAQALSQLEREYNVRQELIIESARKRIDDLHEEANRLKFSILRDAQA